MATKICSWCKTEKEYSEFYRWVRSKDGYQSHCKMCDDERTKEYRKNNAEKIKQRKHNYWENNKDRFLDKNREYYHAHRDILLLKNKENGKKNRIHYSEYHKEWRHKTKKGQVYFHRRRQLERNASGRGISSSDWLFILDKYNHTCLCCGRNDIDLTIDHIIPLSRGGEHDINNIQPLCGKCNSIKGIRTIDYRVEQIGPNQND